MFGRKGFKVSFLGLCMIRKVKWEDVLCVYLTMHAVSTKESMHFPKHSFFIIM